MPVLASNLDLAGNAVILSWDFLACNWTTAPAQIGTTAAGSVWSYTLRGVTRFRLVPEPYAASGDAFYTTFTGGVLSGLIVARG